MHASARARTRTRMLPPPSDTARTHTVPVVRAAPLAHAASATHTAPTPPTAPAPCMHLRLSRCLQHALRWQLARRRDPSRYLWHARAGHLHGESGQRGAGGPPYNDKQPWDMRYETGGTDTARAGRRPDRESCSGNAPPGARNDESWSERPAGVPQSRLPGPSIVGHTAQPRKTARSCGPGHLKDFSF